MKPYQKHTAKILVLLIGLTLLISHKSDAQQPAPIAIHALLSKWAIDLHSKKLNESMALYTNDAVFYSPGSKPSNGKKEITALYKLVMSEYDSNIAFISRSLQASGNMAYNSVDYTETLFDRTAKKTLHLKGNCLFVFKLEADGQWRISQQMWTVVM